MTKYKEQRRDIANWMEPFELLPNAEGRLVGTRSDLGGWMVRTTEAIPFKSKGRQIWEACDPFWDEIATAAVIDKLKSFNEDRFGFSFELKWHVRNAEWWVCIGPGWIAARDKDRRAAVSMAALAVIVWIKEHR